MSTCSFDLDTVLDMVKKQLGERGIDFDLCGCGCDGGPEDASGASKPAVKVVCVAPDLGQSVREMGEESRDQVVMVRVDAQTARTLDAWVETGAVKSRSEAAALFIREGLKVRVSELDRLKDALSGVEEAKDRLRREARDVFNLDDGETPS
jgi:Arc/MetJ-type ribon-helix-helix transcriptional regulator